MESESTEVISEHPFLLILCLFSPLFDFLGSSIPKRSSRSGTRSSKLRLEGVVIECPKPKPLVSSHLFYSLVLFSIAACYSSQPVPTARRTTALSAKAKGKQAVRPSTRKSVKLTTVDPSYTPSLIPFSGDERLLRTSSDGGVLVNSAFVASGTDLALEKDRITVRSRLFPLLGY